MPLWPLSLLLTVASLGALGACLYAVISRGCAWPQPLTCPHGEQLELEWSWWQQASGNDYFFVVAFLVSVSFWLKLKPAEGGSVVRLLAPIGGGFSVQPTTGTLPNAHSTNDAIAQ